MPFVMHLLFSADGRITRRTWWIGIGCLVAWNLVVFLVLWSMFGASLVLSFFGRLIGFGFTLLTVYAFYCLSAKRFQDRNRSALNAKVVAGLWAAKAALDLVHITGNVAAASTLDQSFLLLGTAIGLWYFIELGWMDGTPGPNRYGPDPAKPADRAQTS
jgi:uncharacterized membrane protein YhaH (DUF805 family)